MQATIIAEVGMVMEQTDDQSQEGNALTSTSTSNLKLCLFHRKPAEIPSGNGMGEISEISPGQIEITSRLNGFVRQLTERNEMMLQKGQLYSLWWKLRMLLCDCSDQIIGNNNVRFLHQLCFYCNKKTICSIVGQEKIVYQNVQN